MMAAFVLPSSRVLNLMNSTQQGGIFASLKRLIGGGEPDQAASLYTDAVARARQPYLYRRFGVPDTPAGRYEMVTWQVLVALTLLGDRGEGGRVLGQKVVDLMFADMDRSLRELGVGDLSVGKMMRKLGETWKARTDLAERVLQVSPHPPAGAGVDELAHFLEKNTGGDGVVVDGHGLAKDLLETLAQLRGQPGDASGKLDTLTPKPAPPNSPVQS